VLPAWRNTIAISQSYHSAHANCAPNLLFCTQSWHWSEKRRVAQYYADLYKKEKADDAALNAELVEKLKALEEELMA